MQRLTADSQGLQMMGKPFGTFAVFRVRNDRARP